MATGAAPWQSAQLLLLLTPANAGNQHLAALAALSRPLRNEVFVRRLRQAPDEAALHELLENSDV
jgi:mannitol/fructose-specific phosphotransferase system IIA component (Ntr-type)